MCFQDDMELLQENQEKMIQNINLMRRRMKNMESQNQKLGGMLAAMLKAQGVEYMEEDAQDEEFLL